MTLIVFLLHGETLLFNAVENVETKGKALTFEYFGMGVDESRSAHFYVDQIAGYSYTRY